MKWGFSGVTKKASVTELYSVMREVLENEVDLKAWARSPFGL